MYIWRVTHRSGYIDLKTFESAVAEYCRRTKNNNKATINPVWKAS